MLEEFKVIPNYDGKYSVSPNGIVKNNESGRFLKITENTGGYLVVTLNGIQHYNHKIVLETFNPTNDNSLIVDHINNKKKDNRLENLQWLTQSENAKKAARDGLYLKGSDQPMSKLNEEDVLYIRNIYAGGKITMRKLADYFCVSVSVISKCINRKTWNHV